MAPMEFLAGTLTNHYTLIEGAFATNPAARALVEARTTNPKANDSLVSLGTGEHSNRYYRFQTTLDGHNHRLDRATKD